MYLVPHCYRLVIILLRNNLRDVSHSGTTLQKISGVIKDIAMAHSLSPECTPLKHAYDACFNTWFEGYLEPAIEHPRNVLPGQRNEYAKKKAEEFEQKCGVVWAQYKECVQVSVSLLFLCVWFRVARPGIGLMSGYTVTHAKLQKAVRERGLGDLLEQARQENPLREPPSSSEKSESSSSTS